MQAQLIDMHSTHAAQQLLHTTERMTQRINTAAESERVLQHHVQQNARTKSHVKNSRTRGGVVAWGRGAMGYIGGTIYRPLFSVSLGDIHTAKYARNKKYV